MLQDAYLLAKVGADTAENERNFAEILPKIGNYPTGPPEGCLPGVLLSRRDRGGTWHRSHAEDQPFSQDGYFVSNLLKFSFTNVSFSPFSILVMRCNENQAIT